MKNFLVSMLILSSGIIYAGIYRYYGNDHIVKYHLININADIDVLIAKDVMPPDTVTVYMHEIGKREWKYDVFNSKDTTFWIENSYEDRTKQKKLPPHFVHYKRAIVVK